MSSSSAAMWLLSQGSKASTEITARSMRARSLQTSASRLAPEDEAPRKKRIGLISRLRTSVTSRLGFTGQSITSELEQEQLRERVAAGKANPFEQLLALPPKELEALTADRLTAPSLIRNKPVEVPKQTMSTPWFRHSHRKLNDLARLIAGRHVDDAIHQMEFSQKLASKRIKPVLLEAKRRALAKNIPAETLVVSQSWVDKGSKTKVIDIRGRGKHGVIEHADTRLKLILQEGKKTDQKRLDKVSLLLKKRLRTGPGRVQTNRPIINGGAFAANAYNW
ncbi:uncharacterized protein L969DRAFT_95730 [Mixia osmundae IAM 14324]|uniref:Ribosomal protein L22 n=1 Tax=Mixia osmundae (strain CBS 9802 / IAM 14324 / JCM 22182 / KY 12970) TaxID=764103 RepID=G7E0P0_MIXOS|nr:uncharacterized protein L969DRAFT_95730 [Mixia osmundae IAM 14324]KEI37876.1 hypothetical protein L969DRAFT_95730 [Mixia osmundae IAM 14324]GAA96400.1 hypothetical protein E5Q_03067 [Mixia osmundae IAM 14324]